MMRRRLRQTATALLALFTVFAAHAVRRAPGLTLASRLSLAMLSPEPAAHPLLPAGFSAAIDLATSARFVRVVARDIDRDGDLDVVASVGTLDLLVWENDGAGHFSRVASRTHDALRAQPPAPAVDGEGLASNHWIQNDQQRGAHLDPSAARGDEAPGCRLPVHVRTALVRYGPRVRSSRAPPLS